MNKKIAVIAKVAVFILVFFGVQIVGTREAVAVGENPDYLPVRLAVATFDPMMESAVDFLPADLVLESYPSGTNGYYLVQFSGPIYESDKSKITDLGGEILDYIPDFTFIVRMDSATKDQVAALEVVRWVGIYQPGYRIATRLSERYMHGDYIQNPDGSRTSLQEMVELTVMVFPGEDIDTVINQVQQLTGTIFEVAENEWEGELRIRINSQYIAELSTIPGVRWVERAPEWQLDNSKAQQNTIMDTADVWVYHNYYGTNQTIAIADTQLDTGIPSTVVNDFRECSGTNTRVIAIINRGGVSNDTNGHGTHVAGSVAGNGRLGGATCQNYAGYNAGSAPEARIYFQGLLDSGGGLGGIPSDLNVLFQQAYDFTHALYPSPRIHTNSWGSTEMGGYTSDSRQADEFSWSHKDFQIFFSAGNEGVDIDSNGVVDPSSIGAPGTAKNVITVGASENVWYPTYTERWNTWEYPVAPINNSYYTDNASGMAPFSSRGPTDDGRYKPDIVAPGIWVFSVWSSAAGGPGYTGYAGTSMSTPLTAGAGVLARQVFMDLETYAPSGAMLKALLTNGATDIYPGQYGTGAGQEIPDTRPTFVAGWGRVDLEDSLFPATGRRTWWWDHTAELQSILNNLTATGATVSYEFYVQSNIPLHATLAWTDYFGTEAASGGLVNDLDMYIVGPSGTVYANNAQQRLSSEILDYAPNWNSLRGPARNTYYAMRITPTQYPATLSRAKIWWWNNSVSSAGSRNVDVIIYDDNGGPGPTGGTVLCTLAGRRLAWGPAGYPYPTIIDLSSCGTSIPSGSFYLALNFTGNNVNNTGFLMDPNAPIGRGWYNTSGSWVQDPTYDYAFAAVVYRPITPVTPYDRVNNLEGIDIASPTPGTYTLYVNAYNVPQGPQPYALTLSGDYRMLGSEVVTRPIAATGTDYKFGNTGVTMNFTSESLTSVTVTVHRNHFPTTGADSVKRLYEITSVGGAFNATVAFGYEQAEFDASGITSESSLKAYQWTGSAWVEYPGSVPDPTNNTVTVSGVTGFSLWTLGDQQPTAMYLVSLQAKNTSNLYLPVGIGLVALPAICIGAILLTRRMRR